MDEVGTRRQSFRSLWLQHRFTVVCVFAALVASFFTYHVFSDGDFSFLMTLGSLCVAGSAPQRARQPPRALPFGLPPEAGPVRPLPALARPRSL